MDMSKLQTQQAKLNVAPLHLNKMLDEIEIMMSAISNEKHIIGSVATSIPLRNGANFTFVPVIVFSRSVRLSFSDE